MQESSNFEIPLHRLTEGRSASDLHLLRPEDYDGPRMSQRTQTLLRGSIAILLLFSLAVVLVHWHDDRPGQDCGLCYAHQMPGLQSATSPMLGVPEASESRLTDTEQILVSSAFVPSHPGRAPPRSL
jgi:hypothetical protein